MTDRRDPASLPPALQRLLARAERAILAERAWRSLAPVLVVLALFCAVSWSGLWLKVDPVWRMAGVAVFAAGLLFALSGLRAVRRPSQAALVERADADGLLAHHPIAASTDALALGRQDDATRALWALHQRRAAEALASAKPAQPRPDLARRDPWALRSIAALAAVGALFIAGPEWRGRVLAAFDWTPPVAPPPAARIDGWIDPPAYTRVAPIMLQLAGEAAKELTPPVNSTIVIRTANAPGVSIGAEGALGDVKAEENGAANTTERRYLITGKGSVSVRRDGQVLARIALNPVPDLVPLVTVTKPPVQNGRGGLTIHYKFEDDYGIASAEAQFRAPDATDPGAQPLVDPPTVQLSLPGEPGGVGEGQTLADLASHPWAGAKVRMIVSAKDEAGQEGTSDAIDVVLPQRAFGHPLAKALIEQRRGLVMDARKKGRVLASLDALMINPERYTPQSSVYLGLKTAHARLTRARAKEDMLEVAEYLWGMAVYLEDGDLSQTERDLRAAQEALRQALERGASDEEIKKLMQDLRAALDKYMQQLAEQMRRDGRDPQDARPMGPNDRVITQRDLQRMLDRMEQMAREGSRDEARRMLDEMQKMLENLQQARPQRGRQQNQQAREMNRALEDLDRMIREQERLRDETFQDGQQQGQQRNQRQMDRNRQQQARPGQQGQRQQGQRGQHGQRGQQGQQGQQGEQGEQGEGQEQAEGDGEGQQGQGGGQGLAQRQEQLRQRLENLRNRMRNLGQNGQGMGEAEEAMRDAERQLGQGNNGEAADAQGRAVEAMRRGAQQMAQQMMRQQGQQGEGDPNGDQADGTDNSSPGNPDDRRRAGNDDSDPLGRPPPTRDAPDTSRYRLPGASAAERSQRVLEELRRRLSDPSRPLEEMDYLRRLLRPY